MNSDLDTIQALLEVHKDDPSVYISNGFLYRVEADTALIAKLNKEQKAFFDASVVEFEKSIRLEYESNQEYTKALAEAEVRAEELKRAKDAAEAAQIEAIEARKEAEGLARELETDRNRLEEDLERQKSYELIADKQRALFSVLGKTALPAWIMVFSLLVATTILSVMGKETQAFVTILSIAVGTLLTMYATGFTSMFAPMTRDEKPRKSGKINFDADVVEKIN